MPITAWTLTDGGQRAADVARGIAAFVAAADTSLDLALYDVRFSTDAGALVLAALTAARGRGVRVRLVYNVDHPGPIPVPPPPELEPDAIELLPIATRGIAGVPDLMHHKFVVRDGTDVWTGSTNWTDDSWTRQENVVVEVTGAPGLGRAFAVTFDQLWSSGTVEGSGAQPRPVDVGGVPVRPWFCPAFGDALSHRMARHLCRARRRIRIASPVLTSGPILSTLADVAAEARCDVVGVVDVAQVREVLGQWTANEAGRWKIPLLDRVLSAGGWSGKPSTPWQPGGIRDSMHAKVVVADDVVFVGSFNLSRSGERNAESVLEVHDRPLADDLAAFVEAIAARYPGATDLAMPGGGRDHDPTRPRPSAGGGVRPADSRR